MPDRVVMRWDEIAAGVLCRRERSGTMKRKDLAFWFGRKRRSKGGYLNVGTTIIIKLIRTWAGGVVALSWWRRRWRLR